MLTAIRWLALWLSLAGGLPSLPHNRPDSLRAATCDLLPLLLVQWYNANPSFTPAAPEVSSRLIRPWARDLKPQHQIGTGLMTKYTV